MVCFEALLLECMSLMWLAKPALSKVLPLRQNPHFKSLIVFIILIIKAGLNLSFLRVQCISYIRNFGFELLRCNFFPSDQIRISTQSEIGC